MVTALGDWIAQRQHCSLNSGWPTGLNHNQSRWRLWSVAKRMLMQDPVFQFLQRHEFKRTCIQR